MKTTETKQKHTPTPWYVHEHSDQKCRYFDIRIKKDYSIGEQVAKVNQYLNARYGPYETPRANAALIVRAVNSHAALVEALGGLLKWMEVSDLTHTASARGIDGPTERVEFSVVADARAALALAEGGA